MSFGSAGTAQNAGEHAAMIERASAGGTTRQPSSHSAASNSTWPSRSRLKRIVDGAEATYLLRLAQPLRQVEPFNCATGTAPKILAYAPTSTRAVHSESSAASPDASGGLLILTPSLGRFRRAALDPKPFPRCIEDRAAPVKYSSCSGPSDAPTAHRRTEESAQFSCCTGSGWAGSAHTTSNGTNPFQTATLRREQRKISTRLCSR